MVNRVAAAFVLSLLVLAASACVHDDNDPKTGPSPTLSATATASPAPVSTPPVAVVPSRTVPWSDALYVHPGPTPPPDVSNVRPCTAADLETRVGDYQGAGGSLVGGIVFRNTSPTPCFLRGRPSLTATGEDGAPLPFVGPAPSQEVFAPVLLTPNSPPPWEAAAGHAYLMVSWRVTGPAAACENPPPPAGALALDLGGSLGVVHVELTGTPFEGAVKPCAPVIGYGPFGATEAPEPPATPPPDLHITAAVEAPATIHAGETLNYRLILQNTGTTAVVFTGDCPRFFHRLDSVNNIPPFSVIDKQEHLLNCRAAGQIAPGEAVAFEMEMPIPVGTPGGAASLGLGFAPDWSATKIGAEATVTILP